MSSIANKEINNWVSEFGKPHLKLTKFDVHLKSASKSGENYTGGVHRPTFKSRDKNQNKCNFE